MAFKPTALSVLTLCILTATLVESGGLKKLPLKEVYSSKGLEKFLGEHRNSLLCFVSSKKAAADVLEIFEEAAKRIDHDQGTMHVVDCSEDGKKLCDDLMVSPEPHIIHYYRKGRFNKVYEGKESPDTIVRFMHDPEQELPWHHVKSEVVHLEEIYFSAFLRKKRHALVIFYAPWCGHCKSAKPQFQAAAQELKGQSKFAFAAVDCTSQEELCRKSKIEGYPTIKYYNYFNMPLSKDYVGSNIKEGFVKFLVSMDEEFRASRKSMNDL